MVGVAGPVIVNFLLFFIAGFPTPISCYFLLRVIRHPFSRPSEIIVSQDAISGLPPSIEFTLSGCRDFKLWSPSAMSAIRIDLHLHRVSTTSPNPNKQHILENQNFPATPPSNSATISISP
jgi:hypothetical protein